MAGNAVTNPSVVVNNVAIAVVPNTVKYTSGLGEQKQRVQSAGGGNVDVVYSDNVETHMAKINFHLINTADNIALVGTWKQNLNNNVITITGNGLQKSFTGAAIINDPENNLGADGVIEVEFHSLPAV